MQGNGWRYFWWGGGGPHHCGMQPARPGCKRLHESKTSRVVPRHVPHCSAAVQDLLDDGSRTLEYFRRCQANSTLQLPQISTGRLNIMDPGD